MGRSISHSPRARTLILLLVLAAVAVPAARAAEPLEEDAYGAWVGDHAIRLMTVMQLPGEFTLGDLRDLNATLAELVAEARAVEAPPRFAAAHADYLRAMDAAERVQTAFQTVIITRRPVPELRGALEESSDRLGEALRRLDASGVALPAYLAALVALTDDSSGMLGLGSPMLTPFLPSAAPGDEPAPAAAPPAQPPAAPGRPTLSAGEACGAERGCAASDRLRLRVLTYGPVLLVPMDGEPRRGRRGAPAASASAPAQPDLVGLRIRVENRGGDSYLLQPGMLSVHNDDGRQGRVVHLAGLTDLVPREGLRLDRGETREGMVFFSLSPPRPRALLLRDGAAPGGTLAITLP